MKYCKNCPHKVKVSKDENVFYLCTSFILKQYLRKENGHELSKYYEILNEDESGVLKCNKCMEGEERISSIES